MKKAVAFFLVVLSVFMLLDVSAMALTEDDFIGVWYLDYIETGGIKVSAIDVEYVLTLTLYEDKTGELYDSQQDVYADVTWMLLGGALLINDEDELTLFFYADEELFTNVEDVGRMVFTKESSVNTSSFEPAVIISVDSVKQFNGFWNAVFVDVDGMLLVPAEHDVYIYMAIADGSLELAIVDEDGEVESITASAFLIGSSLYFIVTEYGENQVGTIRMHEDGMISLVSDALDEDAVFYFEQVGL